MQNTISNPDFVTASLPVGFHDAKGRFWPLSINTDRIGKALVLGVDLVKAARTNLGALFDGRGPDRLVRIARTISVAAGLDDESDVDGIIADDGSLVSPEDFGRLLADPPTFERAGKALALAVAAFFKIPIRG